jgi:hypothetical protein
MGVGLSYLSAAIAADEDDRLSILAGLQPMISTPDKPAPESLAEHFKRSSIIERVEAARQIGASVIWDDFLNPILD